MSDEKETGYVPHRVSQKQEKIYKTMTWINRTKAEMRKKTVTLAKKRGGLHDAKEILSGVIMPWRGR